MIKVSTERDLRLDLFRGLALWLIFLDHIPNNIVSWLTIRNYGFSDATEIFIFISGYTAAFVYGHAMLQRGFFVAGARILKRGYRTGDNAAVQGDGVTGMERTTENSINPGTPIVKDFEPLCNACHKVSY